MRRLFLATILFALASGVPTVARPFTVVAYNVENLFDVDGRAEYDDYNARAYTRAHALTKLRNAARVVAQFENGRGPDVLLLCELEVDQTPSKSPLNCEALLARYAGMRLDDMLGPKFNREVADLPAEMLLAKAFADRGLSGYRIVVGENIVTSGAAQRLAQTNAIFTRFPIKAARAHRTLDARAVLEAQLDVDGATLHVFANHWKSGASDPATEPTRVANAKTLRARIDEILRADPNADIILGGDFNSQYNQNQRYRAMKTTGMNDVLGAQGNELSIREPGRALYNLWFELPVSERGSDTFRGEWGTLMHLIVTRGLYDFRGVQYVDDSFAVGKFAGINADQSGLPWRWSFDGPAGGGVSDHFPVSARFVIVNDNRPDRYLALRHASTERKETPPSTRIDYSKVPLEKVAVHASKLPAGAVLRSDAYKGKIVRVEGRVVAGRRLAVEFLGQTYDAWSFDAALRNKLRAEYRAGEKIRFYGELGLYRGRWQFVIQDPSWVR